MKTRILAFVSVFLAALVPVAVFAAPKKKKGADSDVTCASDWRKKPKDFSGKTVNTFVLSIGDTGTVMSDAPAAVVPVETGNAQRSSGGKILVVVAVKDFGAFVQDFQPTAEKGGTSFGGKVDFKKLSAEFAEVGGESVLLYKAPAPETLADFVPSDALDRQLGSENGGSDAGTEVPEGFEKKVFRYSKLGQKPYTKQEFKRLLGLYNKSVPKNERLKESEAVSMIENGEKITVLDEKAKVCWRIRD